MEYRIPLFNLNFDDQEEKAVIETIRSRWISTGPRTAEFETKFAKMLKIKHAISLANCTVALHLAMKICNIKTDDEVICPSLTFVATVNAIRYVNARPIFADVVGYEDLTIDPMDIERKITNRTKAIVVMHYGGFSCDMERIMEVASKHKIKVIEDACHAPLSEYKGKKLGTIGNVGCFSFFSNKNISTGEGGMLVTNNDEFYERTKLLRSHGMTSMSYERAKGHSTQYDVIDLGFNYRMDDIRAAIGIVQLNKLKADLAKRSKIRRLYLEHLGETENIFIPFRNNTEFTSNYIFPIILKEAKKGIRDKVRNLLAEAGIQTSVHYPAVHKFSIYKDFYTELPKTEYITENLVTLPMYSDLSDEQILYISNRIKTILK